MAEDLYRIFYRFSWLFILILSLLLYLLGIGVARYLGAGLETGILLIGMAWVAAMPSISGITKSIKMTWGCNFSARSTASLPLLASMSR